MRIKRFMLASILVCLVTFSAASQDQTPSSAAENVQVLEVQLIIPNLQRERTIRLYLPPGYQTQSRHYPVIYMHDGQNLFDNATAYAGEWMVDETLNQLAKNDDVNLIVVGIDNGQDKRMNELSPWLNPDFSPAQGESYLSFITDVVKPYIDANYRTRPERKYTAIAGSSMGGLMSHYAIYRRPDVFSKAIIYSPSYWFSQRAYSFTQANPLPEDAKLVLTVGSKEGEDMVASMLKMVTLIEHQGHLHSNLQYRVVEGAEHNEVFWASQFAQSVKWLFEK